jgi:hypothetical protein
MVIGSAVKLQSPLPPITRFAYIPPHFLIDPLLKVYDINFKEEIKLFNCTFFLEVNLLRIYSDSMFTNTIIFKSLQNCDLVLALLFLYKMKNA